jgi:hypothetical protein
MQAGGEPGDTIQYMLTITNTGRTIDYFQLTVESNWPVIGGDQLVGPLEAGKIARVDIYVQIPIGVDPGAVGHTEITATSLSSPMEHKLARLITNASGWIESVGLPVGLALSAPVQCVDDPNHIYLLGGQTTQGTPLTDFLRYDVNSRSWEKMADLPVAASSVAATCVDGKIYVVDGTAKLKIYHIAFNEWVSERGVPVAVQGAALGANNGMLYLAGGISPASLRASNRVYTYNISLHAWSEAYRTMPAATAYAGVAQHGNVLYIVGGLSSLNRPVYLLQRFDMGSSSGNNPWQTVSYPTGMLYPSLVITTDYIYVMGGDPPGDQAFTASDRVERLSLENWQAGVWELLSYRLLKPVSGLAGFCMEVQGVGQLWSVGGFGENRPGGPSAYPFAYYRPVEACWFDPDA